MLQTQIVAATWPIPGDVPDLNAIIDDQAETMTAQAALIDAYQGVLNAAQSPPPSATPATGTGSAANSTQLVMSAVTGTIVAGAAISTGGLAFTPPLLVLGQISGTPGGVGTYLLNQTVTLTTAALTFSAPATVVASGTGTATGNQLNVSAVTGVIANGAVVSDGTLVPVGTTILGQISGVVGGAGIYLTSQATLASATPLTFQTPVPSPWPTPQDAPTLTLIQQQQTAVLRMQSSLIQAYQDLLNTSQTHAPPTGP